MNNSNDESKNNHKGNVIPLKGKTVLVTGASSGIGEALSKEFAKAGLNVVLAARRTDKLGKVLDFIANNGGNAIAVKMDVTSREDVARGFKEAEEKYGPIHFTVANAGYSGQGGFTITDKEGLDTFEDVFRTNVFGVLYTMSAAILSSKKSGGGAIVAISSIVGGFGVEYFEKTGHYAAEQTAYCSSKSAVDTIIRSSLNLKKDNIRVYALGPFVYESEMADAICERRGITVEQFGSVNPFTGKPGNPREMAPIILSLFDNSTLYKPGSLVLCDNHLTMDGNESYSRTYAQNVTPYPKSAARDFQGKPYVWPQQKS